MAIRNASIKTNVMGMLSATHYIKDDNGFVKFIHNSYSALPKDKKFIILSATANEFIYRKMFGDRLRFIDIGHVEQLGRIEQITNYSFSRYSLKNEKNRLPLAQRIVGAAPVITFKDYKESFPNPIAHYYGLAGSDQFNGQSIYVVGTPHMNPDTYVLYANAIGIETDPEDKALFSLTNVEHNGYRFKFNTFPDNKALQEIQFSLIESELTQAVGRARTLRNDCTVTVLSNFPVPGASFRQLSKQEL